MASTETPAPGPEKVAIASAPEPEAVVEAPPPVEEKMVAAPPPEVKTSGDAPPRNYFGLAEVVLRFVLFASALVAVVVMVTSKQTELVVVPFLPFRVYLPAKFDQSPALIYFVAALSVAGLYSIITTLLSFYALLKPGCCPNVLSHLVILDVILLGIVAAATGAAGSIGYIGLKGNSHVGWNKVCSTYDDFCKHLGASIFVSLFASIVLVFLVWLSIYSLSKKIPK